MQCRAETQQRACGADTPRHAYQLALAARLVDQAARVHDGVGQRPARARRQLDQVLLRPALPHLRGGVEASVSMSAGAAPAGEVAWRALRDGLALCAARPSAARRPALTRMLPSPTAHRGGVRGGGCGLSGGPCLCSKGHSSVSMQRRARRPISAPSPPPPCSSQAAHPPTAWLPTTRCCSADAPADQHQSSAHSCLGSCSCRCRPWTK